MRILAFGPRACAECVAGPGMRLRPHAGGSHTLGAQTEIGAPCVIEPACTALPTRRLRAADRSYAVLTRAIAMGAAPR